MHGAKPKSWHCRLVASILLLGGLQALTVLALCEAAAGHSEVARLQAVLPALTLKLEAP